MEKGSAALRQSWLVIDRKELSADRSFFFPGTFLRGAPLPALGSLGDVAYLVSETPEAGFRLRGWAIVREVDAVSGDGERGTILQFKGRIREPVPLLGPTMKLREILGSRDRDAREWRCSPGPLEPDDIAYLDKIVESHGAPLPERRQASDDGPNDVRLYAVVHLSAVLERELSDNVRNVFIAATKLAKPSRMKEVTNQELDLRSVVRALIHYAVEIEAKPINYPRSTLKPVMLAQRLRDRADPAAFRAEFVEPFAGTGLAAFDPQQIALSVELNEAIEQAAKIARATTKKERISLRHLTAALFLSEGDGPESVRKVWRDHLNFDLLEFAPEFLRAIEASPLPSEDLAAWRDVLAPVLRDRPAESIRYHTAYGADLPDRAAKDSLDITADVEAFAELICLESAKPPISIGLFGDWGSGKSFFMEKLSQRIEQLTAGEAGREGSPFVGNVVQIRFNAWTYADSENLWASLTAEFFDQLRAGGFAKTGDARYQEVVNTVRSRVAAADDDLQALNRSVSAINGNMEATKRERAALEEQRKSVERDAAASGAGKALLTYIEAHKSELAAACRQLGLDVAPEKLTKTVETASKTAADWFGKLKLTASAAWCNRNDARLWFWLGLGLVLLGLAVALPVFDLSVLRMWVDSLIAAAGAAVSALLLLRPSWNLLRPLFVAGVRFRQDVEARRRNIDTQIEALTATLAGLESEAKKAGDDQAARTAFIARYEAGAQGHSPAALLHFFLHGSEATREYDKHLGLVSRVRRSFEVLNALMLRPESDGGRGALPSIDRIVLYIDDLDRCRDAQAVQVLEAVHLLLAFPLFVVVVGVDARWLQHSLAKHYDEQLSTPDRSEAGKATVTDYLEKIFQIPFWLRPLTVARDGTDGTYERLIGDLTVKPATASASSSTVPARAGPTGVKSTRREVGEEGNVDLALLVTPLYRQGAVTTVAQTPTLTRTEVEVRKAVELDDAEIKLMKAMGPLVGKSPRTVKRFINLYRLIRARRAVEELEAFLGRRGGAPVFPVVMFLLAIDAGLAVAEGEAVFGAIRSYVEGPEGDASDSVAAALDIEDRVPPIPASYWDTLVRIYPVTSGVLAAVSRALGSELRIADILKMAPEVQCYSFRHQAIAMPVLQA